MPRHGRGWAMREGGRHKRHSPMMVTMLEPFLLLLLKERPAHGYNLLSDLQELGFSSIHPSVIYRILREMEKLGWISSDWDTDSTQGPPRKNYTLTGDGENALTFWRSELENTGNLVRLFGERLKRTERSE